MKPRQLSLCTLVVASAAALAMVACSRADEATAGLEATTFAAVPAVVACDACRPVPTGDSPAA